MTGLSILRWAYAANVLILVPAVAALLGGGGIASVFEGRVAESEGLRLMVASLWTAILLLSLAGLLWPQAFAAVLVVQVIYKSLWLALFALPMALRGEWQAIPLGISVTFLAIAVVYPLLMLLAFRSDGGGI
jgi:hypothetical protein